MDSVKIHRSIAKLKSAEIFHFDTQTDKPVILCLHGRWGRAETWYDFIQRYGREYRIIAPDQRGHGLSSKPVSRYTADEMAGDMVELRCPVLLLRAKGSGAVPDEDFHRMQSMIANCMAREISTTDHNVHLADKEKFYKYFDEFLAWSGLS